MLSILDNSWRSIDLLLLVTLNGATRDHSSRATRVYLHSSDETCSLISDAVDFPVARISTLSASSMGHSCEEFEVV